MPEKIRSPGTRSGRGGFHGGARHRDRGFPAGDQRFYGARQAADAGRAWSCPLSFKARASDIIDDILDFSKIEAGKLDLSPAPSSIKEVIEGTRRIYRGNASSKGLLLTCDVDPEISPALVVDPLRLGQIINNFVSNAVKFTTKGTVKIKAKFMNCANGKETLRFSVTDTGLGISAENQARLFQPFVQATADTSRRYGGSGLGLTICRRLADMMGGTLAMKSEPGKGTTMTLTVTLPIADPQTVVRSDLEDAQTMRAPSSAVRAPRRASSMPPRKAH